MDRLQRLIAALWFGSAVFLMLSASAAFRAAGSPLIAADVVSSILTRWHYIALAAPLALFAIELRRARPLLLLIVFTAIVLAASQSFVDLRIRAIRTATPTGVSNLDPEHPTRKRFGALHGLSMALLLAQAVAAALVVMARPQPDLTPTPKEEGEVAASEPMVSREPLAGRPGEPMAGRPSEPAIASEPMPRSEEADTSGGGP